MSLLRLDPAQIDADTPPDRNRVADLLRLGAILMVVLGHWLVAVVVVRDGELVDERLIAVVPETQIGTWLFQVMPLFFVIGGYVNAGSWVRALERGEDWALWVRRRSRRLLGPLLPLLAVWVPLAVVLDRAGVAGDNVEMAAETAFIPVWFLVVYLAVIGLVPATWWLHRRAGPWAIAVTVLLIATIDLLHRGGVPAVGFVNYLLVWGGIHQLGYMWHDDHLPDRPRHGLGLAAVSLVLLVALVTVGGYSTSMVAVDEVDRGNTDPPTVALFALALVQLGVVLAARSRADRWLQRPRVWAPVTVGGRVVMTVFLWHMTALVIVAAATHASGVWPEFDRIDGTWWALRPVWLLLCAAVLAALVAVFQRFEQVGDPVPRSGHVRVVVGSATTIVGMGLVLTGGVYQTDRLAGLPLPELALLLAGLAALGVLRPQRTRADAG